MTASSLGSGPDLFSIFSNEDIQDRIRRQSFVFSLLGQAALLAMIIYFTSCVIRSAPEIARRIPKFDDLPLIFSGRDGGGGGDRDPLPASHGDLPQASLNQQIVQPTVKVPTRMPILSMPATVDIAPDIKLPQGGQIGDPSSPLSRWLSNGPGGRGGMGS